jgi:hypothetical protein
MSRIFQYYGQYQNLRGGVGTLPGWGRLLLFVAAIPGVLLIALSILALGVSILALLLLTVPVYKLVRLLTPARRETVEGTIVEEPVATGASQRGPTTYAPGVMVGDVVEANEPPRSTTGRRTIDVTIVE